MRDRGKSWSQSSSHTVLKDAADYAWRLETCLSYTVIPPHKSVLCHPLFADKAPDGPEQDVSNFFPCHKSPLSHSSSYFILSALFVGARLHLTFADGRN